MGALTHSLIGCTQNNVWNHWRQAAPKEGLAELCGTHQLRANRWAVQSSMPK